MSKRLAAAVESAKASLTVRKRELERAEAALIETAATEGPCCTEIRAPVTGRILRVLTESEQVVQAGTTLLEIGDPTDLEVTADLLSRDAVMIKPGATAAIDNWGGAPLAATVSRIDPSANHQGLGTGHRRTARGGGVVASRRTCQASGPGRRISRGGAHHGVEGQQFGRRSDRSPVPCGWQLGRLCRGRREGAFAHR